MARSSAASGQREPLLSVVIPLMDERGYGLRCLRGWNAQTLPRRHLELIVVDDGSRPDFARQVQSLLRPQDRFLQQPADDEMELYDLGCRAARGDLVLITEGHVLPEPDTAEELLRFFQDSECDAAMLDSDSIMRTEVSRMEDRDFCLWYAKRSDIADWRRVTLRGLAVRRRELEGAGGLRPCFGRFAETALAFEMHRRGKSLGFIPAAKVHHVNSADFREMGEAVRSCARGQIAFRLETPAHEAKPFLDDIDVWTHRTLFCRPAARRLWLDILQCIVRDVGRAGYLSKTLRGQRALLFFGRSALFGFGWRALTVRLRLAWTTILFYLPLADPDRRYRLFRRIWEAHFELGFIEALADSPRAFSMQGVAAKAAEGVYVYSAATIPEHWLVAFHSRSEWEGRPCRWTRPHALMRLDVPAGDYTVILDLRSPLPRRQWCLRLFFNGEPIPDPAAADDGAITFTLAASDFRPGEEQHLSITCRPCTHSPQVPADAGLAFVTARFLPQEPPQPARQKAP
ncbi:MAG TPA: glycosyltransferase family A protein [Acidobacteriota bacterium]|nr:glycosyltransferase family A protein [Acidobacteriota bacterium]